VGLLHPRSGAILGLRRRGSIEGAVEMVRSMRLALAIAVLAMLPIGSHAAVRYVPIDLGTLGGDNQIIMTYTLTSSQCTYHSLADAPVISAMPWSDLNEEAES